MAKREVVKAHDGLCQDEWNGWYCTHHAGLHPREWHIATNVEHDIYSDTEEVIAIWNDDKVGVQRSGDSGMPFDALIRKWYQKHEPGALKPASSKEIEKAKKGLASLLSELEEM